uniref:Uncharacterized protein n=1 Tax=Anguilla anguilla TaxID=7936 RepID=A0A0E9S8Y3_ANGAN
MWSNKVQVLVMPHYQSNMYAVFTLCLNLVLFLFFHSTYTPLQCCCGPVRHDLPKRATGTVC